ncbi:MAG: hypothetical protein ABW076_04145 [Candidatus Thiodiazotropha sp.]
MADWNGKIMMGAGNLDTEQGETGLMWVFIKGIASGYSARDLSRLVCRQMGAKWSLLKQKTDGVTRSKILKIKYTDSYKWEYHGMVYIDASDSVHELMGRLNTTFIKGARLHAHPYIRRISTRDRRKVHIEPDNEFPGNRRKSDRRRGSLVSFVVDSVN